MDADFYQNAQDWLAAGLSLVPIAADASKAPATKYLPKEDGKPSWNCYREQRVESETLCEWLKHPIGLGIIGGTISGNLVIFDFDEPMLAQNFLLVAGKDAELADIAFNLPQVSTPNDGTHLYLRCTEAVGGSQKLAYNANHKTRIETKAEGGYVLAPGCPKACHPNKKTYVLMRGNLSAIPVVTPRILEAFYRIAKLFDEKPPEAEQVTREQALPSSNGHKRPGDDYNERGDLDALLLDHGWQKCGATLSKQLWKRPGKSVRGISATSNYADTGLFYVFSSNAQPFEANRAYTKFATFALLEHSGIYTQAASALNKLGYGDPLPASMPIKRTRRRDEEDEPEETHFPLTDSGNAERFVRDWKGEIRYCEEIGKWLYWEGGKWAHKGAGCAMRAALKTVRKIYSEAEYADDKETRRAITKWAAGSENANKIRSMVDLAKNDEQIAVLTEELDAQHWLLNVANGIINLNTGQLYDHDPNAYLTRQVKINFDPDALCPLWDAFLARVIPDQDVRDFARRIVGYTLTGDISEQCLFFLHGKGRNGKSTFIEMISTLLGEYWTKTSAKTIMVKRNDNASTNDLAALRGCRLVTGSEIGDKQHIDEALVKDMTGGDTISARFLYAESFNFNPVFKLFLYGNHKPTISQTDEGIWRRIRLIPFEVDLPEKEQDKHLKEKLRQEMPGILNWAIRGCLEWQEIGLSAPRIVTSATSQYRTEMDQLAPFFEDCCTLALFSSCDKTELWRAYKEWSEKNDDKTFETARKFNHMVASNAGIKEDRSNGHRIWKGIEIGKSKKLFDEVESLVESLDTDGLGSKGCGGVTKLVESRNFSDDLTHEGQLTEKESLESLESLPENQIFEMDIEDER